MGVFYNPQGQMPLSQFGFDTQVPSVGVASRGRKQPAKRDLAAEKQDAMAKASKVSDGDPDKYADTLTKLGYAEDAVQYKDKYAKAEEQKLKAEELEVTQYVERLRVASDLARSGREDLATQVANKMIPDMDSKFTRMKYNSKKDSILYETHSGETGEMSVEGLLKAGTDSATQFKEMAATYRTKLSTMKDPKNLSMADLLANAAMKRLETEKDMSKGMTKEEVIKKKPHLALLPFEKELILKHQQGDLSSVVAAFAQSNPGMFETYGVKTAEGAASMMAKILKSTQDEVFKETSSRADPKGEAGTGAGALPKAPTKEGTSISTSERSHPSFKKNDKGLLIFKTKDGDEVTVHPTMKDDAIKDGLTPVSE